MENMNLDEQRQRNPDRGQRKPQAKKGSEIIQALHEDTRSLNSAVSLLTQKMKHLARNEKILGQNLIVLNKKINAIKQAQETNSNIPADLLQRLEKMEKQIDNQQSATSQLNDLLSKYARENLSGSDLMEFKHLIQSVNPLDFVTIEQLKDYVGSVLAKKGL